MPSQPTPIPPVGRTTFLSIDSRIWCYYAAFIVLALGAIALGPTLTELAAQTGSEIKDISLLFSMRSLGILCTVRLIGGIYDKAPGHRVMGSALLVMGFLLFLFPFITHLGVLTPVIFLVGITGAFVDLGGNILTQWAVRENLGPSLNGLHFSFGVGAFISPLIVALALTQTGHGVYAYWIISILCLPVALWIFRTPTPENPTTSKVYEKPPRLSPLALGCIVLFFFLYSGSEQSFGGWIHTYGVRQNGMDEVTASYLTSIFWGAITVGRLLAIFLVHRISARRLVTIQMIGGVGTLGSMVLFPNSSLITWVGSATIGLLMSSIFPLTLAYLERYTAGSGRTTSWFFVGASSGSMTLPWIIGQFIEPIGPQFFPAMLTGCMVLGTACIILVIRQLSHNN